ncbi:MAG: hypothetical protein IJK98_08525 [Clostridia bacterium]|nr:hypothetical protein [Clostridia bacterium]
MEKDTCSPTGGRTEQLAAKYLFLRETFLKNYQKGKALYRVAKLTTAAIFIAYTLIAAAVARHTGRPMGQLVTWIILLFLIVFLFVAADYARWLLEDRVIPWLKDDGAPAYDGYDLFKEDEDDEAEEQEDDEE